jgi:hypothetical protein
MHAASKPENNGQSFPLVSDTKKAKKTQQDQALQSKKAPKGLFIGAAVLRCIPDQIVF